MNKLIYTVIIWTMFLLGLASCGEKSNTSSGDYYSDLDDDTQKKKKEKKRDDLQNFNLPNITLTQKNARGVLSKFAEKNPEDMVMVYTKMGNLKLKLYKETPLHRANFIRLTKIKYFDQTQFHRVVKDFMIQGGGGGGLHRIKLKKALGNYRVPNEIMPGRFFHKRGALATARIYENNPKKRSNPYNFYIIQCNTKYNAPTLNNLAQKNKFTLSPAQIKAYAQTGGVPSLDGLHTVFGELVEGFDVLDKIALVKTKKSEWPEKDIIIDSVRIVK